MVVVVGPPPGAVGSLEAFVRIRAVMPAILCL
jgi:hypothetical protein